MLLDVVELENEGINYVHKFKDPIAYIITFQYVT